MNINKLTELAKDRKEFVCSECGGSGEVYSNSVKNSLNPLYPNGIIPCPSCRGSYSLRKGE